MKFYFSQKIRERYGGKEKTYGHRGTALHPFFNLIFKETQKHKLLQKWNEEGNIYLSNTGNLQKEPFGNRIIRCGGDAENSSVLNWNSVVEVENNSFIALPGKGGIEWAPASKTV